MKKFISLFLAIVLLCSVAFSAVSASEIDLYDFSSYAISQMYPEIFRAITEGLRNHEEEISLEEYCIPQEILPRIYESAIFENPDIFYVNPFTLDYSVYISNDCVTSIRPNYIFDIDELPEKTQEFNAAVDFYLSGVDSNWSNFKKCRYMHDMLATTVEYDTDYNNDKPEIYSAYGAMVGNVAVCQGYTLAYNYLLGKLGIKAYFIESHNMSHSWSLVKLGNSYYHVDIVWDDPTEDMLGRTFHTYCLKSDNYMKKHRPDFEWVADYQATNNRFDNAWWNEIDTFIFTVEGKDYYVHNYYDAGKRGAFLSYDETSDSHKVLYKIEDRWYVDVDKNQYWSGSFSSLAYDGKLFYFNTPDAVYSIKPTGKGRTLVYQRPKSQKLDIFGIAILTDGRIYAEYQEDPMTNGVVYAVDSKESVYKIGDVNTDGIINVNDVTILHKHLISEIILSSKQVALADFNKDDVIDIKDVTAIQKKLAGIK